jgi:hypothetical protein
MGILPFKEWRVGRVLIPKNAVGCRIPVVFSVRGLGFEERKWRVTIYRKWRVASDDEPFSVTHCRKQASQMARRMEQRDSSLRRPTRQERRGSESRPAPLRMTGLGRWGALNVGAEAPTS